MFDNLQSTMVKSLSSHIFQSQREVTILFTDIEGSTHYWEDRGAIHGRLMVDRHNRLLQPIVRQFRGRVIKTIGDSLMTLFHHPQDALLAAIAMQQALRRARETEPDFAIHIRIGMHIGDAIVEPHDAFGDVVNVAARIEAQASGNEILLSAQLREHLATETFTLQHRGSFSLKGKQHEFDLYSCLWQQHPDLLQGIRFAPLSPLGRTQRLESIGYGLLLLGSLYYVYQQLLRYLLADHEPLALFLLDPRASLLQHWPFTLLGLTALLALCWPLWRRRKVPYRPLKHLKGAAAAGLLFVSLHTLGTLLPFPPLPLLGHPLYTSEHLFVEVQHAATVIRQHPDEKAEVVQQVDAGTLLLLTSVQRRGDITWNQVLLGQQQHGWLPRIQPARIGIARQRVSLTGKFQLQLGELLLLLLTLPAYRWGYRSFRLRPL